MLSCQWSIYVHVALIFLLLCAQASAQFNSSAGYVIEAVRTVQQPLLSYPNNSVCRWTFNAAMYVGKDGSYNIVARVRGRGCI